MLADFVTANHAGIIERVRARVESRTSPQPTDVELTHGIPVFLEQLTAALRFAESSDVGPTNRSRRRRVCMAVICFEWD